MTLPTDAHSAGEWLVNGGAILFLIYQIAKYFWGKLDKAESKEAEAEKAFKIKINADIATIQKNLENMDKSFQTLASKENISEVKYQEHVNNVAERRKVVDMKIEKIFDMFNGMMQVKAKEIAEFDTGIKELQRRVNKLEDRTDGHPIRRGGDQ